MHEQAPLTPEYDLGHYLRPLQRHRRLVVVLVLAGLILGLAYSAIAKRTYVSTARLNVIAAPDAITPPSSVNPQNSRTTGQVNLDTEAQVVKSSSVAVLAQKSLHTTATVGALLKRVTASVPANSTVLAIAYTASSPAKAQAGATAFANAYLANRKATEQSQVTAALTTARKQVAAARATLKQESTVVAHTQLGTPARTYAQALEQTLQNQVNSLNTQINELTTTVVDPGNIISAAQPGVASAANRLIPPISGLVLGFIVAMAAVFWREHFDKLVRNSDDLAREGVPLLAELKNVRGRPTASRLRRDRIDKTRFDQRVASVVAGAFDTDGGVVYVAPVSAEQTHDDVADHLASTLASVGHHVELVRPASIEMAAAESRTTFADADDPDTEQLDPATSLLGWPEPEDVAPSSDLVTREHATLMPSAHGADPVPMSLRIRLEAARRRAQFVIIDGDPAVADAQAYILAGLSDASLLVVDPVMTTRADLAEVVDQISVTPSHLLGAVIWRPSRNHGANGTAGASTNGNGTRPAAAARRNRVRPHAAGRPTGGDQGDANRSGGRTAANGGAASDDVAVPHRIVDAAR